METILPYKYISHIFENQLNEHFPHIILLVVGLALWLYASFPTLRYMIELTDGQFNWKLVLWLVIMIISIFLIKFSLFSLTGWPAPGTWMSRLFLGIGLFMAYLVPFAREYLLRFFRR